MLDTVEEALSNLRLSSTRIMISVDDDDALTIRALNRLPDDARLVPCVRKREDALGEKYNRVLFMPATLYTHMSDYAPCTTPGFDAYMLEAASLWPDGIGVVFSNPVNHSFAGIYGVTKGLADKLGWFFPPYFPYWFVDHWIDDIARLIGRISHAAVTIDTPGGKPGTQELRELPFWTRVFDAGRYFRRRQAANIITSPDFEAPAWEKQLLLRNRALLEHRSMFISDSAREMAIGLDQQPELDPPDERYLRVKARALVLMANWAKLAEEDLG